MPMTPDPIRGTDAEMAISPRRFADFLSVTETLVRAAMTRGTRPRGGKPNNTRLHSDLSWATRAGFGYARQD
jgi:hypothetical protein